MTRRTMTEIRRVVRLLANLPDEDWERICKVVEEDEKDSEVAVTPIQQEPQERTYEDVTKIIHKLGVPANIKGYDYLRSAIICNLKYGNIAITRELYPTIAKEFDTTPQRVERAIRHAISRIYAIGDEATILEVFGNKNRIPTNSEVIATIAEYLRFNKI